MAESQVEQKPTGQETTVAPVTPPADTQTVNWEAKAKEYEGQLTEFPKYKEYFDKMSEVLGRDEDLYSHLESAARGQKWEPKPVEVKPPPEKPKGELPPEIVEKLKQHDTFISQAQQEREFNRHLRDVENELKAIESKWPWVDEAIQGEFAKRVEERVKSETMEALVGDPTAKRGDVEAAVREKWSSNLIASFVFLMEDKIQEQLRESAKAPKLPFQLSTPADKIGKPGVNPSIHEKFKKALESAESAEERAQIKMAYAKETGKDINSLFAGAQMP